MVISGFKRGLGLGIVCRHTYCGEQYEHDGIWQFKNCFRIVKSKAFWTSDRNLLSSFVFALVVIQSFMQAENQKSFWHYFFTFGGDHTVF